MPTDWGGGAGADIGRTLVELGRIRGENMVQQGNIWGHAIANIGNTIEQAPVRQMQQQEIAARTAELQGLAQDRQLKAAALQRDQQGSQVLAQAIGDPANHGDPESIYQAVSTAGFPEHAQKYLKNATDHAEALGKITARRREDDQAVADVLSSVDPSDTVGLTSVVGLLQKHGIDMAPYSEVLDASTKATGSAADGIKHIVDSAPENVKAKRAADLKRQELLQTPQKLGPDEIFAVPGQNGGPQTILAQGLPKQATGLEKDDQRYESIQQQMGLKQQVSPEDRAWAQAYERRKTLGPEATAAAASDRLARTQGQQIQMEAKREGFAESQAGRKELTEKVEQPYQDAVEKASTLRSVIDAAKNGNMEAANVQSLLGTLGLVTMEGVKRINTTELNQVAGAGSLLERIKSQVGSVVSGKPLSPRLQQDLQELSGVLEQSARKKYEDGFTQITKRYNLGDEKMIPGSSNPVSVQAPNGKTYTFQSQADADAFKAKAGIK